MKYLRYVLLFIIVFPLFLLKEVQAENFNCTYKTKYNGKSLTIVLESNGINTLLTPVTSSNMALIMRDNIYLEEADKCPSIVIFQDTGASTLLDTYEVYNSVSSCKAISITRTGCSSLIKASSVKKKSKTQVSTQETAQATNDNGGNATTNDNSNDEVDWGEINSTGPKKICNRPEYRKITKVIGTAVQLVRILVPMLIIALGIMDLYKAVINSKNDGIKNAAKSIAIRALAGVAIFLLPGIVQMILNLVNEYSKYSNTWCCCTQCILDANSCDVNSCNSDSCKIGGMN